MSDKYILRSNAIDAIKRGSGNLYTREAECLLQKAISLLKSAPAADVVPVVRCRACKYLVDATINANGFLICDISGMEITPDDFCSYGEYQTNMGGVTNE